MARRRVYLVSDARERDVTPHLSTALAVRGFGLAVSQINTADFLICAENSPREPEVLAAFERKTWADLAAGENKKDLRNLNLGKLLRIRRERGAKLFMLLEGQAFPAPDRRFGHYPCSHLVTLLTRLMVWHGIFLVQTASPEHSARRLAEFVRVFSEPDPFATALAAPVCAESGPELPPPPGTAPEPSPGALAVPADLTAVIEKPESVAVTLAWARLPGISADAASAIACSLSVADLAGGGVADARLSALLHGRRRRNVALLSLRRIRDGAPAEAAKLLSGIRGLSPSTASQILDARRLRALCAASVEDLAGIPVARRNGPGRLGPALAKRLWSFLRFRAEKKLSELSPEEKVGRPRLRGRAEAKGPLGRAPAPAPGSPVGAAAALRAPGFDPGLPEPGLLLDPAAVDLLEADLAGLT